MECNGCHKPYSAIHLRLQRDLRSEHRGRHRAREGIPKLQHSEAKGVLQRDRIAVLLNSGGSSPWTEIYTSATHFLGLAIDTAQSGQGCLKQKGHACFLKGRQQMLPSTFDCYLAQLVHWRDGKSNVVLPCRSSITF